MRAEFLRRTGVHLDLFSVVNPIPAPYKVVGLKDGWREIEVDLVGPDYAFRAKIGWVGDPSKSGDQAQFAWIELPVEDVLNNVPKYVQPSWWKHRDVPLAYANLGGLDIEVVLAFKDAELAVGVDQLALLVEKAVEAWNARGGGVVHGTGSFAAVGGLLVFHVDLGTGGESALAFLLEEIFEDLAGMGLLRISVGPRISSRP